MMYPSTSADVMLDGAIDQVRGPGGLIDSLSTSPSVCWRALLAQPCSHLPTQVATIKADVYSVFRVIESEGPAAGIQLLKVGS